jgi:hypothetical protein
MSWSPICRSRNPLSGVGPYGLELLEALFQEVNPMLELEPEF